MTARAESPVDGSVWMGTSDNGLLRLGRNGKYIHYTAEDGKLVSNAIKSLCFDGYQQLWILYGTGQLGIYSSTGGFEILKNLPEGITATTYSPVNTSIYIAASGALYSLKDKESTPAKIADLDAAPYALYAAADGAILAQSASGIEQLRPNGDKQEWAFEALTDELQPIEIEDITTQKAQEAPSTSTPIIKILLLILLIILALAALSFAVAAILRNKNKQPAEPVITAEKQQEKQQETKIEQKEEQETQPEQAQEPAQEKPAKQQKPGGGPFTKQVKALIMEHLSEPDFDVEQIAAITGMSRIHVNRKLKAEGTEPPSAILKRERMELAARYIKEGEKTISEISTLCGFRTQAYFSTAFKEYFGCKPSEYKGV